MDNFIVILFKCSFFMSIITIIYALSLLLISKHYTAKWCYHIWLIIVVGWLIPIRPTFNISFLPLQNFKSLEIPKKIIAVNTYADNVVFNQVISEKTKGISLLTCFFIIWLVGVLIIFSYHVLRHMYFMKVIRHWSIDFSDKSYIELFNKIKQEQIIKEEIKIKICDGISSPMLIGLFKPIILLPNIKLSKTEFAFIVKHELIHFKRHDLWYKLMILTVSIIHWFNPIIYFMAKAVSMQCELSCDEILLKETDIDTRVKYGQTIITLVRNNIRLKTSLSTNFYGGKSDMKVRIKSILNTKKKKISVIAFFLVLFLVLTTGSKLISSGNQISSIDRKIFTDKDYKKISELYFDSYENMTISEFQQKVWKIIDNYEDTKFLDRLYQSNQFEQLKDTDKIAGFVFYELIPLTSENWKTREFLGSINYKNIENTWLEYTYSPIILDADKLTVGKYSKVRKEFIKEFSDCFSSLKEDDLGNKQTSKKILDTKIEYLKQKFNSNELSVNIEYFLSNENYKEQKLDNVEKEDSSNEKEVSTASSEDYNSILKLKTENYSNMILNDFNTKLLEWANENYDRMERIFTDISYNKFPSYLSYEEISFLTFTINYSSFENAALVKSIHTEQPKDDISFRDSLYEKTEKGNNKTSWTSLYYEGSYKIKNSNLITVGERDYCIGGVINDIREFWNSKNFEDVNSMNKEELVTKLKDITKKYSNEQIVVNIQPEQINFEKNNENYR